MVSLVHVVHAALKAQEVLTVKLVSQVSTEETVMKVNKVQEVKLKTSVLCSQDILNLLPHQAVQEAHNPSGVVTLFFTPLVTTIIGLKISVQLVHVLNVFQQCHRHSAVLIKSVDMPTVTVNLIG
jgi:hypothetical protein